ncbi:conjugal transfer pilus assembly protein TraU [Actimicrobium sp. CCI2.3]|uniref:conjugal transfer pilus assembly protein TraU n=1 Tax=Actimicrobium sp. CCI2.3 TaxID=3048616 RepID=UPI002AB38903|nr:conjugal transfer pilus assembly protein TraU [Actimicrobium sp. CCI2.3]MDY7574446.1 conjugal transfer pilus assembly protein TraU [Actimicrobium sp. CCI2.3]MEB0022476.1 conjugal transfer pilus assembly protein TraU [Actimicrobium sp. CCI2.3]
MTTRLFHLLVLFIACCSTAQAGALTCTGKFPNPLTDICWSCLLPLSIGAAQIGNLGGQEDIENPSNPVCSCGVNPTIGLSVGFWEPVRQVEVVRKPFCLVTMGGINLDPGLPAAEAALQTRDGGNASKSFYQAHFYVNPVLYWLDVIADFPCLERGGFDLAYLTEVDPLWADDELSLILHPDAALFANPVAIAACAADCVAASVGFGVRDLFWCAGCQGGLYPMDGHVPVHLGGIPTSVLIAQRLTAKMHRELLAWGAHGTAGLCGPYFEPVMDKRAYKTQLTYPIPNTGKDGGKCCQPFGRTTVLWGAGKEYPVQGEDFAYLLFRKRNCCLGY